MDLLISALVCIFGICIVVYGACTGLSMAWSYSPSITILSGIAGFCLILYRKARCYYEFRK